MTCFLAHVLLVHSRWSRFDCFETNDDNTKFPKRTTLFHDLSNSSRRRKLGARLHRSGAPKSRGRHPLRSRAKRTEALWGKPPSSPTYAESKPLVSLAAPSFGSNHCIIGPPSPSFRAIARTTQLDACFGEAGRFSTATRRRCAGAWCALILSPIVFLAPIVFLVLTSRPHLSLMRPNVVHNYDGASSNPCAWPVTHFKVQRNLLILHG